MKLAVEFPSVAYIVKLARGIEESFDHVNPLARRADVSPA